MESEHTRKGEDEGGECTWYAVKSRAEQSRAATAGRQAARGRSSGGDGRGGRGGCFCKMRASGEGQAGY